ncbi:aminotransferase class IV family protein [Paracoccus seriniphilus]|uniref:aminotransferase class IV family protein n=1 Tax=Paracoccus seriniphilus TaxID=184748 RepID=UPI003569A7E8
MQIRISEPVPEGLKIIETMRGEADGTIRFWQLHLARLRRDCAAVGFPLDPQAVKDAISSVRYRGIARLRLTVDANGRVELVAHPLPENPPFWTVALSTHRLDSADPWLRIKSTRRPRYDAARSDMLPGQDEVLLLNERSELCEGSITNLFVRDGERYLTPPLGCGLLPGILRQSMLEQGIAREAVVKPADLTRGFFMGNALRGLIPARLQQLSK